MFELIRANKRKSVILLFVMALVLLGLGYVIGTAWLHGPQGGYLGLAAATIFYVIMLLVSLTAGDKILLSASRAQKVTHDVHPQLFNVVEEMTIAAGLPKVPDIYIINDPAPNAFATGRSAQTASVAVTAGLLGKLNRDELQGVIAHEISHILHRDILFVTLAGIMLGAIVMLSQVFLRGTLYGAGRSRRFSSNSNRNDGGAQIIMIVVALVLAILAPIMAHLLYMALSRRREYLADAGAARLTRYPAGLANALQKIADHHEPMQSANKVTAPMYIANPLPRKGMKLSDWSSTHPPIEARIKILRNMMHGAAFRDYEKSYDEITHSHSSVLPSSALQTDEQVALRSGGTATEKETTQRKQIRQIGDIMRQVEGFALLTCPCGLKMKVPPNYRHDKIKCPRCGEISNIKTK